uniref:sodium/potassium/calcium exchanger 2-like isoform X2 n=1 Tax=Myxine glutinosa TaxID=7769 RepID=UPI00358F8DA2
MARNRKRFQALRVLTLLLIVIGTCIAAATYSALTGFDNGVFGVERLHPTSPRSNQEKQLWSGRKLLELTRNFTVNDANYLDLEDKTLGQNITHSIGNYPKDIFSLEERRNGAIVLHIFGMIYMFIALAIVCDEFFVPALTVITLRYNISDDVAGATLMAAGGSAPELFTSLIGVFFARSNVGVGTIVGSAVFNILFVIGMCALFSKEILQLTWWPLFRDVSFYTIDLILLILFFLDNEIRWWESLILFSAYIVYVIFMKGNVPIERWVKTIVQNRAIKVTSIDPEERPKPQLQRGGTSASLHNSMMRNGIFQLMIHTLDPLGEDSSAEGQHRFNVSDEGKFREKAVMLHNMAKKKVHSLDGDTMEDIIIQKADHGVGIPDTLPNPVNGANGATSTRGNASRKFHPPNTVSADVAMAPVTSSLQNGSPHRNEPSVRQNGGGTVDGVASNGNGNVEIMTDENEEDEEPLSLKWPDTCRKRITYLFILPIILPLWLTLPDMRKPKLKKFVAVTFLGSILWIGTFSYLMVWWAHQVGETIGITEEIMGLTILAAGTSIPDLITSVIVARKGLGDMAVSSSIGSNIFDITVGLPIPWLLFSTTTKFAPISVHSNGLFCATVLLFLMLLFVIITIALCRWRMNKILGAVMFILYSVFLVLSILLEQGILKCPVSV